MIPTPPARRNPTTPSIRARRSMSGAFRRIDGQFTSIEAGARAGVAGRSLLIDREQDRVTVAVDGDAVHPLRVARGVTLAPVLLAGPGPVHGPPAGEGAAQRLGVHPGEHEHLARVVLLHDHGREAVGVPDDPVDIALHAHRTTTPDPRSACLTSPTVS